MIDVRRIPPKDTEDLILNVHYAHRKPPVSFAFGLFCGDRLEGVVTYGSPAAAPMRTGLMGPQLAHRVLELNRLVLRNNEKNHASMLVGRSLRLLVEHGPRAIISFADTAHGHEGLVYRASNFPFCGMSAKRTDWKIKGFEHLHNQSVVDMFRGIKDRAGAARALFGDDFQLVERSPKYRYVYFLGSRKEIREMREALKYPVLPYPKAAKIV